MDLRVETRWVPGDRAQDRRDERLRSRNDKDFNRKYPTIAKALAALPNETVIDGEVVALDEAGRPSFNALQNGSAGATIVYYVFDVMVLAGRNVMDEPLATRRDLLTREVMPQLADLVREAPRFDAALADLISAVRGRGLEGLVAKRFDSVYEPGARSGAWRKMRLNRSEEFVIGGYTGQGGCSTRWSWAGTTRMDWSMWRGRGWDSLRRVVSGCWLGCAHWRSRGVRSRISPRRAPVGGARA
jgi:ATP-dependent DNA ligase